MNWFKENPFLTGLIAVVIVGCGALGYLISGAASRFAEISVNYDSQASELDRLTKLPLYPNQANLDKLVAQRDDFKKQVDTLKERLASMSPPAQSVSPPDFQARLRERVDAFTARAKAANVALPENFYLGFDAYRSGPPASDAVATALSRQLDVIEKTLDVFILQRVAEIRSINREPLPEERGGVTPSSPQTGGQPGGRTSGGTGRPDPSDLVVSSPFEVSILADQDRIRRSLNDIARLPYFVPVRSLVIRNTSQTAPKRSESATPSTTSQNDFNSLFGGQTPQPAKRLEFIVGTERVELDAKFEYTLFP